MQLTMKKIIAALLLAAVFIVPGYAASEVAKPILFGYNSTKVSADYNPTMNLIVQRMNANPKAKLRIIGYADDTGSNQYNLRISKQRAENVAKYITKHGVDASRIVVMYDGNADPVATNLSERGRALNRRVEFTIFPNKYPV